MHPLRCTLKMVRLTMLTMCCCLFTGLLAPQAGAQAGVAGSLTRGGAALFDPVTRRWGCHPGWGACLGGTELRLILERQYRFDTLRNEPPAAQVPLAGGLWRVPPHAYLPPPTPGDQIVPAYRDSSVLRPDFQDSGKPLD